MATADVVNDQRKYENSLNHTLRVVAAVDRVTLYEPIYRNEVALSRVAVLSKECEAVSLKQRD